MKEDDLFLDPLDIDILDLILILLLPCVFHEKIRVMAVKLTQTQEVDFSGYLVEGKTFLSGRFLCDQGLAQVTFVHYFYYKMNSFDRIVG